MVQLSDQCERFVIKALACFMTAEEISDAALLGLGEDVPTEEILRYDRACKASPPQIASELVKLFSDAREFYLAGVEAAAAEPPETRIAMLRSVTERALPARNEWLLLKALEESRKESVGWYDSRGNSRERDSTLCRLVVLAWEEGDLWGDLATPGDS